MELEELVDALNEKLRAAGADSAERAFGLGFLLGLFPALGVILALFLFKIINVILAFVLVVMASLAILGGAMLLAYQARQNSIRREYQSSVETEINQYLGEHKLSRRQFEALIHPLLPEDAPLTAFLSPVNLGNVPPDELEQQELE